jgi:hypothetical protein
MRRWEQVPLRVTTDLAHGGRWTSLRSPDHEWLWTNPDPMIGVARSRVAPGDTFVDAGGAEECIPTVRGRPDHGDAWARVWSTDGRTDAVDVVGIGRLTRRIEGRQPVVVDYQVTGAPDTLFLHALHMLLDLSTEAKIDVPGASRMTVLDAEDPDREWPSGLDVLGPDDGTAVCALVPGCRRVDVVDGDHALRISWTSPGAVEVCSLLLWRNLGGWPAEAPYRSIGIEPMVGRSADLSSAWPNDCVRIGPSGRFHWSLSLSCRRLAPL